MVKLVIVLCLFIRIFIMARGWMQLRKRIVSLFSLALCLAVLFTAVPAGAEMEFDIESITTKHILLMDAETGSVLYEKGGRQRAYPASTTK